MLGRPRLELPLQLGLWLASFISWIPTAAFAQATAQIPLQFDFVNPGARSLAMGGAYIAQADDATAAFTNPAGLPQLTIEFSAEPRFRSIDSRFLSGGRLSGRASNVGIDTANAPLYDTDTDRGLLPAFASFVFARRLHEPSSTSTSSASNAVSRRWALAVYRQQVAKINNAIQDQGPFARLEFPGGGATDLFRISPLKGTRSIEISNYGVAFGLQALPPSRPYPHVDVGIGFSAYHGRLDAAFARYFVDADNKPATYAQPTAHQTQTADGVAPAFNAGVIVEPTARIRLGAVFRQGPRFDFTQTDEGGIGRVVRTGTFHVPDVIGTGIAWLPTDTILITADVSRVRYSQLFEDFVAFQAISTNRVDQLSIADATEARLGFQYSLPALRGKPQLRAGTWYDPDHSVHYTSRIGDVDDQLLAASLPGSPGRLHASFGVGLRLASEFELNAAADFSSRSRHISASIIVRLPSVKATDPVN